MIFIEESKEKLNIDFKSWIRKPMNVYEVKEHKELASDGKHELMGYKLIGPGISKPIIRFGQSGESLKDVAELLNTAFQMGMAYSKKENNEEGSTRH
jgi:hypothetical protein